MLDRTKHSDKRPFKCLKKQCTLVLWATMANFTRRSVSERRMSDSCISALRRICGLSLRPSTQKGILNQYWLVLISEGIILLKNDAGHMRHFFPIFRAWKPPQTSWPLRFVNNIG